jgi:hypothetical protein
VKLTNWLRRKRKDEEPQAPLPVAPDLERFTSLIESRIGGLVPPRFLDRFRERVVAIVRESEGAVVSFADGHLLASFGADRKLDNPCQAAFEAATAMLDHVRAANKQLGGEPIELGIGLYAGKGDLGPVCAGLLGLTGELGYRLVVTDAVIRQLTMTIDAVRLGPLAVPGQAPVEAMGLDPVVDLYALPEATRLVLERNRKNRGLGGD